MTAFGPFLTPCASK